MLRFEYLATTNKSWDAENNGKKTQIHTHCNLYLHENSPEDKSNHSLVFTLMSIHCVHEYNLNIVLSVVVIVRAQHAFLLKDDTKIRITFYRRVVDFIFLFLLVEMVKIKSLVKFFVLHEWSDEPPKLTCISNSKTFGHHS